MKVGIIGGGVMGLVIALRLSRSGYSVHVMESESQLGGLATWFDYRQFIWDKFYHVILSSDKFLLDLIDELSIKEQLSWTQTKTGFLWHGSYISMNDYWELLTFPALNPYQKLRLVLGILACQFWPNPDKLQEKKSTEWLSSVFGKGVYSTIWEPLLESKFGTLKDKIPASIMYSTINRYKSTRDSSSGKEMMGYLQGGQRQLIQTLEKEILAHDGKISCNCKVTTINDQNNDSILVEANSDKYIFDSVINTLPTFLFRKIAPNIKDFSTTQKLPQFLGVICLSLVLKKQFSPYYVTNLIDKGYPFTGIIEPSNVARPEEFNGKHLLMLPRYDIPTSPWFDKSEEEIRSIFIEKLRTICPEISDLILESFVNRARLVQALWIDSPAPYTEPQKSADGRIWTINSELAKGHVLSNNGIVEIANKGANQFLKQNNHE